MAKNLRGARRLASNLLMYIDIGIDLGSDYCDRLCDEAIDRGEQEFRALKAAAAHPMSREDVCNC